MTRAWNALAGLTLRTLMRNMVWLVPALAVVFGAVTPGSALAGEGDVATGGDQPDNASKDDEGSDTEDAANNMDVPVLDDGMGPSGGTQEEAMMDMAADVYANYLEFPNMVSEEFVVVNTQYPTMMSAFPSGEVGDDQPDAYPTTLNTPGDYPAVVTDFND